MSSDIKSAVACKGPAYRPRESCFPLIPVSNAFECVLQETNVLKTEYRNFKDSFSYVVAEDVVAPEPHPPFPASIKDGYAVIAADLSEMRDVIGVVTPGREIDMNLSLGQCIRISTGAPIPKGADAVIQVEDTKLIEKDEKGNEMKVQILKPAKQMQDIRPVGSDVAKGEVILSAQAKLMAAQIGALATCGIQQVMVFQKPTVALLSTGDEVLEPNAPLIQGCIRDSNKVCLSYMLKENHIPTVDLGIARDIPDNVKLCLTQGFEKADIIITTGGVSMGEKDIIKDILQMDFNATIHFGRILMKPGKPTTFSTVSYNNEKKLVFSLPGNPVSAFVCFYLFVLPCIKKMMGQKKIEHSTIKVQLAHDIKLDERPEYYRVNLAYSDNGNFIAAGTGPQQSSRLLTMQADALLKLPMRTPERTVMQKGSMVEAILMHSFINFD